MHSRRILFENITSLTALQVLNYATPLLTLPYLVRVLEPSRFGLLSFAQGVVLYFDIFTDFGFNFTQTRAIAAARGDVGSISRIFWATLYAKTLLMGISAAGLALLVIFIPQMRAVPRLYAANFLYVVGTTFFPLWFFQGLEQMKVAAALLAGARLLTVPALFLFVRHTQDYVVAGAIQSSVEVVASVVAWPIILSRARLTWCPPSLPDVVGTLKAASALFLSSSAMQLSSSSAIVILGFTADKTQIGYFSAADKLIKAASAALNPVAQALYPHITAAKLRSRESAFELIQRAFYSVGILMFCISIVTVIAARPVCELVLGKSFEHSIRILQCLAPLPLLSGLTNVLGTQTMLVFEMDVLFSRLLVVSAACGIPITFLLSLSFGAVGVAFGSVGTATVLVASMWLTLHSRRMLFWQRQRQQCVAQNDLC